MTVSYYTACAALSSLRDSVRPRNVDPSGTFAGPAARGPRAAIDVDGLAGDVRRQVRRQENRNAADLLRRPHAA